MTMRNYFVTIHKDGHVTVQEYEEPKAFVYSSGEGKVVRDAYNHALRDVKTILAAEKTRCQANSKTDEYGQEYQVWWAGRSIECVVLETAIDKLFRQS